MIGLFSRWRQLGRRYFWPHLLFGMVAAGLGLPVANAQTLDAGTVSKAANTLFISHVVSVESLMRLRDNARRPGTGYWHQHAIRVVIRHLTFSLPQGRPQAEESLLPRVQKIAVLQSLHALLTTLQPISLRPLPASQPPATQPRVFDSGIWLSAAQGIRAGPQRT